MQQVCLYISIAGRRNLLLISIVGATYMNIFSIMLQHTNNCNYSLPVNLFQGDKARGNAIFCSTLHLICRMCNSPIYVVSGDMVCRYFCSYTNWQFIFIFKIQLMIKRFTILSDWVVNSETRTGGLSANMKLAGSREAFISLAT